MIISFSILTYNSSLVLKENIEKLHKALKNLKVENEINILNNGSMDNTEEIILEMMKNIELNYYKNEKNQTFTKSFNKLLNTAIGDVFCIMSDDICINSETVNYVLKFFQDEKNQTTIIAPKTILESGKLDRINKMQLSELDLLKNFTLLGNILNSDNPLDQEKSCFAEVVQDSCLFIHKNALKDFLFDEDFKFYFTEDSLSRELRSKNYKLYYCSDIFVNHGLKKATKTIKNTKVNTIYMKDCWTYSRKYCNPLFHWIIFTPAMIITFLARYIKWYFNSNDYH